VKRWIVGHIDMASRMRIVYNVPVICNSCEVTLKRVPTNDML
jgi:hypothetical protein